MAIDYKFVDMCESNDITETLVIKLKNYPDSKQLKILIHSK